MNHLSQDDIDQFNEEGYLVFEGLFDDDHNQRIKDDVDQLMEDRQNSASKPIISYRELGLLTSEPSIVDRVSDLMAGEKFVHHHIHARWQLPDERGAPWHHDYEQNPQTNRSHLMVHVFMYQDGLNGEVGDLLVLPGSHKKVMNRDTCRPFEYEDLPGSRTIDDLAPASIVIVHSAVIHARRPKPGGGKFKRYFIDTSYCQNGILWPASRRLQEFNDLAMELGWDRDGKYAFLYEDGHFFYKNEHTPVFEEKNKGSLVVQL